MDQTRTNLEKSRDAYQRASEQLITHQERISKTITQLTSLDLMNKGLKAMLPVLIQAVSAFTSTSNRFQFVIEPSYDISAALRSQFFQLTQFFEGVASLLADVLQPSVSRWAKSMESTASLAGVQLSGMCNIAFLALED